MLDERERPDYILLPAGNKIYLLHYEKWSRGSYLEIDLETMFETGRDKKNKAYYPAFHALLSRTSLAPDGSLAVVDQLNQESHKKAQAVTRDLKDGVVLAVELLANEALGERRMTNDEKRMTNELPRGSSSLGSSHNTASSVPPSLHPRPAPLDPEKLTTDCLTLVYRLLFLFYAESRNELELLPLKSREYKRGYSLEMLRDLELRRLEKDSTQRGYFIDDTLRKLFRMLFEGYKGSFTVTKLDSPLFDDTKLAYLDKVRISNQTWQAIIQRLSLSKPKREDSRKRISYANLDINQLGSVYESLLSFRGIIAAEPLMEVHKKDKPDEGTYLTPRRLADQYTPEEILRETDAEGQRTDEILTHEPGTFVYRLNGRDREKSASYYTPEVLTRTVVHFTLEAFRKKLAAGDMQARELMQLKILEPAMGAAAFHNEVINQLSELYLEFRQRELGRRINPDHFQEERQKVKAAIAANNVYGVDLNAMAIELGKLSLWLNVIHREMDTPFFGHRLGRGNAVVGCWLKVYPKKAVVGTKGKKKWWAKAPRPLDLTRKARKSSPLGGARGGDEVYHFLLPDENMVPAADNGVFKKYLRVAPSQDNTSRKDPCKDVREWRKEFCKPYSENDFARLLAVSDRVDELLGEHYAVQQQIEQCTAGNLAYWGAQEAGDPCLLNLDSYAEKERLQEQRERQEAPYFRLKLLMDYWCALWFWDVRDARALPRREEYLRDLELIVSKGAAAGAGSILPLGGLRGDKSSGGEEIGLLFGESLFGETNFRADAATPATEVDVLSKIEAYGDDADLFASPRIRAVQRYARRNHFFHYQLEFFEVFRERGGFDVAVGNPPWLKIQFDEKGVISETDPQVMVRKTSASAVRKQLDSYLANEVLAKVYFEELLDTEGSATFMNAVQNYPLLKGQQTNLYKCIVENGFQWIGDNGYLGLLHPEGLYDDPKGQAMRREIYRRLRYHFQFRNEMVLFSGTNDHGRLVFGIHIYGGKSSGEPSFKSMNNVFDVSTINSSLNYLGSDRVGGIKRLDDDGKPIWNIIGHKDRVVDITRKELSIFAKTFENSDDWEVAKLVSVHARPIVDILEKLSSFPNKVSDFQPLTLEGFHETNAQDKGIIKPETRYPDYDQYELIYSGPHFFVGTPFYKTPRSEVKNNSHYDVIDLTRIEDDYVPRTNYVPAQDKLTFAGHHKGLREVSRTAEGEAGDGSVD